ncbi:hypothetical protein SAMN05421688_2230 [Poseidonocella pacifica]|uniref:Lipoprotein n=1 Tax=Poseidonocella pacifica TaxID=871651 RepID=A0A1I0XFY9_9RHOB|nr:hypothetical protein [Poseidonocella pacifica]SFA99901.1 hypothetical protein SAMN05421688_2230 [Poseidonocella pacifica]
MRILCLLVALATLLAGCGAQEVWAPQSELDRVRYVDDGPAELTLITVLNAGSGNGAHSALLINASERVIFDPAGTFGHPAIPERNDLIYGVSPAIERAFVDYHARITYDVQIQRLTVSRETAERAFRLAQRAGPVPKANCTRALAKLLRELPGFEHVRMSFYPNKLADDFAQIPGVRSVFIEDDDPDLKSIEAVEALADLPAVQPSR